MTDYNKKYMTAKCIDCGAPVYESSLRCRSCRLEHARKVREEKRRLKKQQQQAARKTDSMVINGHVQVCKHIKDCYYGSEFGKGCSYLSETGQSRLSQGLYIENGICPAYRKADKHRKLRAMPVAPAGPSKFWEET